MNPLLTITVIAILLQPFSGFAADEEHNHDNMPISEHVQDEITAQPNELVLHVNGIVCSFCSIGVQKKLSKLPFIDHSKYKDGVHVAIEEQKVTVAIKPNSKADVKAAYKSVKSGGYEPIRAVFANSKGLMTHYNKEGEKCIESC